MEENMIGRTYEGNPANFLEETGPSMGYVRFSSNGAIHTIKRSEWDLLPEWDPFSVPDTPSFDTLGWLYRNLADSPLLANALFDIPIAPAPAHSTIKIGVPEAAFFHDCEPDILANLHQWQDSLTQQHATTSHFDAAFWNDALQIFAPIQASEAAAIHHGNFQHFEPLIAERLTWGASISAAELAALRPRLDSFRKQTATLFQSFDYLLLPSAPMSALCVADDHTETRTCILRYTTPISLCGLPTVTIPGGLQLVAPLNQDAALLALSADLKIPATLQR